MGLVLLNEASAKPKPIYTEFLKAYARDDPQFALNTEKKMEALVHECKLTKTSKKSLNMPIMKQPERRFVHELAAYYGIETQSFDTEPYRNVCLYAAKEKTTLPSVSLMQSIESKLKQSTMPKVRQLNQKLDIQSNLKVLYPSDNDNIPVSSAFAALSEDYEADNRAQAQSSSKKAIDYFDLTE